MSDLDTILVPGQPVPMASLKQYLQALENPLSFFRYLPIQHRFAFEDGTTEADILSYLQDGFDEASETGRALHLPDGKYLGFTRQNTGDAIPKKALLLVRTGASLVLRGNGPNTRFTVPDDFTDDGDYNFIHDYDAHLTPLGMIDIAGIHIDGNGPNNLVTGSSSIDGTIRGAYPIRLRRGHFLGLHESFFTDNPGRNILIASNATTGASDWDVVKTIDNHVQNVGGAIEGNEHQNDHSSFYVQADAWLEKGNTFANDFAGFDPLSGTARAVNAIEDHSRVGVHIGPTVRNYGSAGIVAAQKNDVDASVWSGFSFSCKSNIFSPFITAGRRMRLVRLTGGTFLIDNTVGTGGTAFFQSDQTAAVGAQVDHIAIDNTYFIGATTTPKAATTTHGAQITAAKRASLHNLGFDSIQGDGILFLNHQGGLGISDVDIDHIYGRNVGIPQTNTRVWLVDVRNADAGDSVVFKNFRIGPNIRIRRETQAVGTAALNCRGLNITGPGHLQNFEVHMPRTDSINRSQRVTFSNTGKFRNVRPVHRPVHLARGESPVAGYFDIGSSTAPGERIMHCDPAPGYANERIVTTGGAASEALWAGGTPYLAGQWIRLSSGKTIEYTQNGTSHATTEPTPANLGEQYDDGTAKFVYRDSALATFSNSHWTPLVASVAVDLPSIAANTLGSEVTMTVTGAAAGGRVRISPSGGNLSGIQVDQGNTYTATNAVKFTPANLTGGAIDAPSRTLIAEVFNA